jgi:hypothetical protein
MIQGGGWNRLRTSDEHSKLARISVDFLGSSDQLFDLNVSKTQIRIPPGLRAELGAIASSVARIAQDVYRGHSDGTGIPHSASDRIEAVRALVRTIIASIEIVLTQELGVDSVQLRRIIKRIHVAERDLANEMVSFYEPRKVTDGLEAAAQS